MLECGFLAIKHIGNSSILFHVFAVLEYVKSIHEKGDQGKEHVKAFLGGVFAEGGILPVVSLFAYTRAELL